MKPALRILPLLILLTAAGQLQADSAGEFFFKKGDRIVFLGDSITEQYQYSTDIELYLTTRFPDWSLTFLNAGIGGDTSPGGAARFASHVLAEKPTAVTIDFGMNDGGYGNFESARQSRYLKGTETMLKAAQKAGVRVALISPNAVDRRNRPQFKIYLETQKRFYEPLKELAAKYEIPFVDQYARTRAILEKAEADQAKNVNPFPDGVHTSPSGGLLMAYVILTGLHAPALVSNLDVDVQSKDTKTDGCKIDKLEVSSNQVSFTRTDQALPLPAQKDWESLLPYINHLKDLNWYGLKVSGLSAGKYALSIDGKQVATYTAEQLAQGVNLGNLTSGPIHDQSQKVSQAINSKNFLVYQRFLSVVRFQVPDWLADVATERKSAELAKRKKAIDARQAEVYKLAQPTAHYFDLKLVN
jgi:lysophospholipase L1-like esterase